MKYNKKFDIVLNAIYHFTKKKKLNGMYSTNLVELPILRELRENGELPNILDLLCKDGYIAKNQLSLNKSAPLSYSLTAKGYVKIEDNGFVCSKLKANTTFILVIISTIIALTSLIIQFCKP